MVVCLLKLRQLRTHCRMLTSQPVQFLQREVSVSKVAVVVDCVTFISHTRSLVPRTLPEGSAWHARRLRQGQRAVLPVPSPPACTQASESYAEQAGSTCLARSCAARSRASSWRKTLHALLSSTAVPSSMPCAHLASCILQRITHTQGTRNGNQQPMR